MDNLKNMLALRVLPAKANEEWEAYLSKAA